MQEHPDLPIISVCVYYVFLTFVPEWIKQHPLPKWLPLRTITFMWNLFLSAFSTLGAFTVVPHLWNGVWTHGFEHTVCADPVWYKNGPMGFWLNLFILSKVPELLDTVLLILQQKPIIFLHSYHHVTVLGFCWTSYTHNAAPGIWYCVMNY